MELIFRDNNSSSRISLCIQILSWDFRNKGFLANLMFYFHSLCTYACQKWKALSLTRKPNYELPLNQSTDCDFQIQRGEKLSKEEVIEVMKELGMGVDAVQETISEQDIVELFESKEPSLEEIKEAFDVFDENKDGFIEARELQRVLCCLGIKKDLVECRRMIDEVDQNGDGLVDHNEFVKFMERGFFNASTNPIDEKPKQGPSFKCRKPKNIG